MGKINKKLQIRSPKTRRNPKKNTTIESDEDDVEISEQQQPIIKSDKLNKTTNRIIKKNSNTKTNIEKTKEKSKLLFEKAIAPKKLKTKKEKLKLKHKALINKIDLIKEQELENAKKKKRERRKVIGDLNPLRDALPSLSELSKLKPNEIKTGLEEFNVVNGKHKKLKNKNDKFKQRKQEFLNRYKCFNSVLKDKKFKENPRETIAEHIKFMAENQS